MKARIPEDTIAAVSTPPGEGAIGIVRLSGGNAVSIVAEVFASSRGRDLRNGRGRVFLGEIRHDGAALDEVLVHVMRAPHSYTREDVVEINCHGGAAPVQAILELVLERGARLAEPGEFTKRAFLNGRIDLIQAEAVIDRIRAQTRAGLRAATAAAGGALSRALGEMRERLIEAQARIEAAVDFPDDHLPELIDARLQEELVAVRDRMRDLLATAETGRLYREGARMVVAGRPNVGKSSLFNALLRDARAIVTAHAGTTRDLLEETITVAGVPIRLIDTAGLREAVDEVEQIGVESARRALQCAGAVLFVVDTASGVTEDDRVLAQELQDLEVPLILALNKIDLAPDAALPDWDVPFAAVCRVSATTGDGLGELEAALGRLFLGENAISPEHEMLSRVHQRDSLRRAADALDQALSAFGASPEFISIDVREALHAIGEITGETTPDDILEAVFSTFCIGK
ncbi:MAG: tRNA uridine-5-carboxymethylaminomethyl(34) synthesis GTPase MnmE [FCB group bacterium]|nr:tRNA uridine-5-carboxymethylaminomethyl(34) synthesis GTPase MnmE [FCB group bacterium]